MKHIENETESEQVALVIEDLKELTKKHNNFYYVKLSEDDLGLGWMRRSFGDIYNYYSKYNVSEKILIKALVAANFRHITCPNIGKTVFINNNKEKISSIENKSDMYTEYGVTVKDKYTQAYLENLYYEPLNN